MDLESQTKPYKYNYATERRKIKTVICVHDIYRIMPSATKEVEIVELKIIPDINHNNYEMKLIFNDKERSTLLRPDELASCISSITSHTRADIRRRAAFTMSTSSLPMDSIIGNHEVTEGWISKYI